MSDYITIARFWEDASEKFNAPISGLITPYGLNAKMKLLLPGLSEFTIEIDKQLENIRSSPMSMKTWPICARIKAHFGYLNNSNYLVLNNTVWNVVWGTLKGYRTFHKSKLAYMRKRSDHDQFLQLRFLEQAQRFQSLSIGPKESQLHLLYIPSNNADLEEFLELCKKIKTAANNG